MSGYGTAYFIKRPRWIGELMRPHPLEKEQEFEAVKTIKLSKIDYENFVNDKVADQQFF